MSMVNLPTNAQGSFGGDVPKGVSDWYSNEGPGLYNSSNPFSKTGAQNRFNAAMQDNANAFQLYMSNTAQQRGVQDMIAAGINPMAQFMGNASSGASAQGSHMVSSGSGGNAGSSVVGTAQTAAKLYDTMSKAKTEAMKNAAKEASKLVSSEEALTDLASAALI